MSTTQSLLIVIATYNEKENLPSLIAKLFELIPGVEIVVVDDNSPDGTGRWCEVESERQERLFHIGRSGKLGLGTATIAGLAFGLERGVDLIATMDADWSHDPGSMAEMLDLLKIKLHRDSEGGVRPVGALIGSRYVRGGRIEGWPWFRLIASRLTNWFTRVVLWLPTRDNTGAFRIYVANALRTADALKIRATGYAYLEEMLYRLHRRGFDLIEHPITFVDREKGHSKASLWEGVSVMWNIVRLRIGLH